MKQLGFALFTKQKKSISFQTLYTAKYFQIRLQIPVKDRIQDWPLLRIKKDRSRDAFSSAASCTQRLSARPPYEAHTLYSFLFRFPFLLESSIVLGNHTSHPSFQM